MEWIAVEGKSSNLGGYRYAEILTTFSHSGQSARSVLSIHGQFHLIIPLSYANNVIFYQCHDIHMLGGKWFILYNIKLIRSSLPVRKTKIATQLLSSHSIFPSVNTQLGRAVGQGMGDFFEVTCLVCKC